MPRFRIIKRALILLYLIPVCLYSQERIVGLEGNPVLLKLSKTRPSAKKSFLVPDTLDLPFFDDFPKETVYPDPLMWEDQNVFVNLNYALRPISLGTATFDAVDSSGNIYSHASTLGFKADYLTSRPINLDLPPADSIYLSFYYQPMGIGDRPQPEDSLVLEFLSQKDTSWIRIWSTPGDSMYEFKRAMIPITDSIFLKKGFRFRFFNYASLTEYSFDPGLVTNCDHWHLDYIRLERGRHLYDTVPHDVTITAPLHSLLQTHESLPWQHFKKISLAEMGSFIRLRYSNYDTIVRNVTRNFEIWDVYQGSLAHDYSAGAFNSAPWETINLQSSLIYTFDSPFADSALFHVRSYLLTDDFDKKINDTVDYYQAFYDYFAYDDGTAEAGYGLSGSGMSNGAVACRFESFIPDTLRSIRIYFNRSYKDANIQYFHLTVWNDDLGIPGEIVYSEENLRPGFEDSLNSFYEYKLNAPVPVDGVFYVGWQQTNNEFLNVGYDLNRNSSNRLFYRNGGIWYNTQAQGALMIRPATGTRILTSDPPLSIPSEFTMYPNPARNGFRLDFTDISGTWVVRIFNIHGEQLKTVHNPDWIDISNFVPGMYIIELDTGGRKYRKKLLKLSP